MFPSTNKSVGHACKVFGTTLNNILTIHSIEGLNVTGFDKSQLPHTMARLTFHYHSITTLIN